MIHSAALLAIVALAQRAGGRPACIFSLAGLLLISGMVPFCGDLAGRALASRPLFPLAAPSGGILLIAGWLTAGFAAALAAVQASGPSAQA